MGKKKVPDWLNSPIWSSSTPLPPPDYDGDDRRPISRGSTKFKSATAPSTSSYEPASDDFVDTDSEEPPVRQPVQVTPPLTVGPEISRVEFRDPLNYSYDNGNTRSNSSEDMYRQSQLVQELSRKVINMSEVRRLTAEGIPDGALIRAQVWKLLLRYLPPDRTLWSSELAKKRSQYKHFKDELLVTPSELTRKLESSIRHEANESNCESKGLLPRSDVTLGEHPLSLRKTSIWNQFFQDTEMIEQIDRDVKRTHPDLDFFSGHSEFSRSNQESLKNILIVFGKLNPGIRYVQGMNEILAPIFYVFRNDLAEEKMVSVEADTFFCFSELLSGFRDLFCQQLDNSVVGIRSTIAKLSKLLKEHDEELWRHLEVTTNVNPQFYAFRWITLLLTQEFTFTEILTIWDALLSDPEGPQETLLRICCAMLILVRRRLLAGDFTSNLKLLQHYPTTNISHLLYVANKLRSAH